jgi:ribosomal protein S18 acetylase RimI-like enzyme
VITIREITSEAEIQTSLHIIRESFKTVAEELHLTQENAPTHPSFITLDSLLQQQTRANYFGLFNDNTQLGFVAIEKAEGNIYYLERLAVLPGHRHKKYGETLVNFVIEYAKKAGGIKLSLAMIDSHTVLKDWYKSLGFKEKETKKYEHLPFAVCFMEKGISS